MSKKGENIYHRKDGRWEGRYKLPDDTKYHSVYAKTYTECKKKRLEKIKANEVCIAKTGFDKLCSDWLAINEFRIQKKLSQETLAFESGIHPAYLGRVERGEKCPTIETLYKISKGLKIPLSELLDISSEVKPTNTEAIHRIETVMQCLSDDEAVEVAEIVEKIVEFKFPEK